MSHPLLDQLDRIINLLDKVHNSSIEPVHRVEIEKYLRWAARKVAKAYWSSVDNQGEIMTWEQVVERLAEQNVHVK